MTRLDPYRDEIAALCRRYGVLRLTAFGSALRDDFGPDSDYDFLVLMNDLPGEPALFRMFDLKEDLEQVLDRKVDMVFEDSIRNPYLVKSIEESPKELMYG